MVAFVRRFDACNKAAYEQMQRIGGKSYMVKSATMDRYDPSGFFVPFSASSGGIVLDCGIHDIDVRSHGVEPFEQLFHLLTSSSRPFSDRRRAGERLCQLLRDSQSSHALNLRLL